jgi:predicted GH43/DUF377 family glycosyl hydrolase
MRAFAGPTFVNIADGKALRVYMSGRDEDNVSRIGFVDIDLRDMKTRVHVTEEPILDVGEPGCFDERGVSYPWLVEEGSRTLLYYVGWVAGGLGGFINAPGVAESRGSERSFRRLSRAPLLERTDAEPIGVGTVCVLPEADGWKMWYTSFDRWERRGKGFRHFYCIKYATSADGIRWHRPGVRCINYRDETEYAIGKPCVLRRNGRYEMWYSYRGPSYRIGFATSDDGMNWVRQDDQAGITPSPTGWDSEMVEYAHVFEHQDTLFMTYNGNRYGQTGVGLAVLER